MSLVNSTDLSEGGGIGQEFRQLSGGQLAVAGVAIAAISMILEFIALSGFAPTVSLFKKFLLHFIQMFLHPHFFKICEGGSYASFKNLFIREFSKHFIQF